MFRAQIKKLQIKEVSSSEQKNAPEQTNEKTSPNFQAQSPIFCDAGRIEMISADQ